jgi:RND family efflux transporter MFP subunit
MPTGFGRFAMKPFLSLIAPLLLGIGILSATGCDDPKAAEPASSPSVDRVTAGKPVRKTLKLYTSQPGRIEAFEETPLYPKITGYVDQVKVDIGDEVKKNDVLITLWVPEMLDDLEQKKALLAQADAEVKQAEAGVEAFQAAVKTAAAGVSQAEAGVLRAEADFQSAKSEHERIKELAARGSQSQKLADEALNQFRAGEAAKEQAVAMVRSAQAALTEAQAHVKKAQADKVAAEAKARVAGAELAKSQTLLDYAEIKAPFDGVITRRNVDTRHYVHPPTGSMSTPLLIAAQTKKVRIFVDVPEMEAALVDGGKTPDSAVVVVQSLGGQEFKAPVTRTSWSLDSANRSLRAEIDIDNPDGVLRPGMYATAAILLEQRDDALTVPVTAIVREGQSTFCCLVESGKIQRASVKLGIKSGSDVEVLEGLDADQTVVLARADSLKDGQPVEVISAKE